MAAQTVRIVERKPAVFQRPGGACNYAESATLFQDGSPVNCDARAASGDVISIFFNGAGLNETRQDDGEINRDPGIPAPADLRVDFYGRPSEVLYFGPALGQPAGIWQANIRVPEGMTYVWPPVCQLFSQRRNGPASQSEYMATR